jgi:hypothetical protein
MRHLESIECTFTEFILDEVMDIDKENFEYTHERWLAELVFRKKCQEFERTVVTISLVMLSNRATNSFTNHQMLDVASRWLRIFTILTCTHEFLRGISIKRIQFSYQVSVIVRSINLSRNVQLFNCTEPMTITALPDLRRH